jgi:hypothetical protein
MLTSFPASLPPSRPAKPINNTSAVKERKKKRPEEIVRRGSTLVAAVDGGWSRWSSWSVCGSDCSHSRRRSCDDPAPSQGGRPCQGKDVAVVNCTGGMCNGQCTLVIIWTGWGDFLSPTLVLLTLGFLMEGPPCRPMHLGMPLGMHLWPDLHRVCLSSLLGRHGGGAQEPSDKFLRASGNLRLANSPPSPPFSLFYARIHVFYLSLCFFLPFLVFASRVFLPLRDNATGFALAKLPGFSHSRSPMIFLSGPTFIGT